jgi:hypothetical protein
MALSYLTNFAMAGIAAAREASFEAPFLRETKTSQTWGRFNKCFHVLAISVAVGSLVLFLVGMFAASDAITHLLATK